MSGWSETITTAISAIRGWCRWKITKRSKRYENKKLVADELERRRVKRLYKLQISDDERDG